MVASVVQFNENRRAAATGATVIVTLGAAPTSGNLLVACCINSADSAVVPTLDNGTWVLVATVHTGNGTNWANSMYYQKVATALSATTTMTTSGQTAGFKECSIIELAGVDTFNTNISTNNTSTTSGSITPIAGKDIALISSVGDRDTTPPPTSRGNPVAGQTVYSTTAMASEISLYRMITAASGSYTIGTTGAPANSSFIGASFYSQPQTPTQGYINGIMSRVREQFTKGRTIFVPDPIGYNRRGSGLLIPA